MTLERLIEEIRARAEQEVAREDARGKSEATRLNADRDSRIRHVVDEVDRQTHLEITRERAQRLAAAKLQARKLAYEAQEKRMTAALSQTRDVLAQYTKGPEYPDVLKRMYALAVERLGKQPRVSGRSEDASQLRTIAGKGFDPTPAPILGGLVAETADGNRRLNLSFDELLRLREDKVRELLAP